MTGHVEPNNVVQFRAIPYATIPARYKRSILLDSLETTNRDFTKHGFACPQIKPLDNTRGGLFKDEPHPWPMDEFKCTILQINIPLSLLQNPPPKSNKLPVLVYIHGGGFYLGNIDSHHSTHLVVSKSITDAQPIIAVNIQYRVGALGFLYTDEANSNCALNDQRTALLWLQKFIGGFGGDRERVTVFGESAGSMSICYHMLAPPPPEGPLFNRAILMSGILGPISTPVFIEQAEARAEEFKKMLQKMGVDGPDHASVEDVVAASQKLIENSTLWLHVQADGWFGAETGKLTWDRVPELLGKCEWVDEIVVGTTGFEGPTMIANAQKMTPTSFLKGIEDQIGPKAASRTKEIYRLTEDMDQNLFLTPAMQWIGDVVFDAPAQNLVRYLTTKTDKKVYRYIFDARNPFPGHPLYQTAHHWVDIYYLFMTCQFRYPSQRLKDLSKKHAQLWTDFANGKAPWKEFKYGDGEEAVMMIAEERDGWIERTVAEDAALNERDTLQRAERLWETWAGEQGILRRSSTLPTAPFRRSE
ncbi:Alpha/Beta hydrolase protein [Lophiotrema nucula]|uniref:Carboxylic ester hydrolase n=1 Tax=Lophiotrema nucula TaxID=690887 RepID=A0A6A5ZSI7_9PLEO|nr:Alpha/Beta hydrolase protein [Lophiotrema nucula]